jgi:acetylornithine deacetylase/succinyl-diaminopimelate desuccinylase-like protein
MTTTTKIALQYGLLITLGIIAWTLTAHWVVPNPLSKVHSLGDLTASDPGRESRHYVIGHPIMRTLVLVLVLLVSSLLGFANTGNNPIRQYRQANEHEILTEFVNLLSIPNVASDRENIRKNAAFILEMMKQRGLTARLLETKDPSVPSAVYAEWKTPGAVQTIIFYAHYDGQPTDPKQWTKSIPWQPALFSAPLENGGRSLAAPAKNEPINGEWRLYGRSASDDKAGVMAILRGFDALRANHIAPTINIKFFFEGEEEAGSPHLGDLIAQHQDLLQADAWIICDGPVHQSGRKQVVFGAHLGASCQLRQ